MKVLILAVTVMCCTARSITHQPGSRFPSEFVKALVTTTGFDEKAFVALMQQMPVLKPSSPQTTQKIKPQQTFNSPAEVNHHIAQVSGAPKPQTFATVSLTNPANLMSVYGAPVSQKPQKATQHKPQAVSDLSAFDHHSSFQDFVSHFIPAGPPSSHTTDTTSPGSVPQVMPFMMHFARPSSGESVLTGAEDFTAQDLSGQFAFRRVDGSHSSFQGQDSKGRHAFGHWGGPSNKFEVKDAQGRTVGMFSYINPNCEIETRMYLADAESGFRVFGSDM